MARSRSRPRLRRSDLSELRGDVLLVGDALAPFSNEGRIHCSRFPYGRSSSADVLTVWRVAGSERARLDRMTDVANAEAWAHLDFRDDVSLRRPARRPAASR